MDQFILSEPEVSDYYADLGLQQQASSRDIKTAFHRLAKKHHPDKKAPGKSIDAQEFRKASLQFIMTKQDALLTCRSLTQVREAYDCLINEAKRSTFDALYFDLRNQWTRYQEQQETRRKEEEQNRADEVARQRRAAEAERAWRMEAEQRAVRERAERKRKTAEAEMARKVEEEKRAARERAERERMREERARQAEERSQEAARRAREEQEQAAKERLHREKEREAEERSEETARRTRIELERVAQERLKTILIEEKQDAVRRNWAKMREAAECREAEPAHTAPPRSPGCAHPQLGWPRKKGRASCVFCRESCSKWSFRCPECNVSACLSCKDKYCMY